MNDAEKLAAIADWMSEDKIDEFFEEELNMPCTDANLFSLSELQWEEFERLFIVARTASIREVLGIVIDGTAEFVARQRHVLAIVMGNV